ncbi:Fatty acyl-CoA reductase 6, chloroplastic [Sesamum angolense]|uniref:Fatty acyl-CoA reductase n=1 Tax=Sesamum angolense TaxID=2727404 RepID=A0AAE2BH50_9LAMI|nr:Fatty acyl-CoA reductase 6, chloroplastic [Sesamum angolense]
MIDDSTAGIGILDFFQGKNIFITGATGFLGKALVEKLLRSTAVGKIYVLIKAKDKAAAFDRLKTEENTTSAIAIANVVIAPFLEHTANNDGVRLERRASGEHDTYYRCDTTPISYAAGK